MIIAIDGPAGSGKSTIARTVAQEIGFDYINSGRLYRAVTYYVIEAADPADASRIPGLLSQIRLEISGTELYVNGTEVSDKLHQDIVDKWVPHHSAVSEVRSFVNRIMHESAAKRNTVVEGRDITTVVFPDAEVKVYLDASLDARAKRRYSQGTSNLDYERIRESIHRRDELDQQKPGGKLTRAHDALYIDTSHLTIEEVCDKVLDNIHGHLESSGIVNKS